jgi:hypothetical protein
MEIKINHEEHEPKKLTPKKMNEIMSKIEGEHRSESEETGLRSPSDAMKALEALRNQIEAEKQENADESK